MHAASISTTLEPAIGGNGMSIKETLIEIVAEYRGIAPSEVKTDATFREMGLD